MCGLYSPDTIGPPLPSSFVLTSWAGIHSLPIGAEILRWGHGRRQVRVKQIVLGKRGFLNSDPGHWEGLRGLYLLEAEIVLEDVAIPSWSETMNSLLWTFLANT